MHTDGSLWELFHVQSGGSKLETTPEEFARRSHKMQMRGPEIFKIAVKVLGDFAVKALEANGLAVDDLAWIVPHQANQRIIEGAAKRIGFPLDRVIVNIDRFGNTSAATVPTGSWPSTQGTLRSTYQGATSPAQTPTVAVFTRRSPGSSSGTGRSSTVAWPGSRVRATRIF